MTNSTNKANQAFNAMMQKDFCSQWMHLQPVLLEEGRCKIEMTVKQEMLNGFEILHGGIAFAFADSALAFAANSYGNIAVSINGSINYLKSAKLNDVLIAEAKAIKMGNTIGHFEVEIREKLSSELYYTCKGSVFRTSKEL